MKVLVLALSIISVAITAMVVGSSASAEHGVNYNCDFFNSQLEAQAHYRLHLGDPDGLDADKDGVACEDSTYTDLATDLDPVVAEAEAEPEAEAEAEPEAGAEAEVAAVPATGGPPPSSGGDLTGLFLLGATLLIVGGIVASVALRPKSR